MRPKRERGTEVRHPTRADYLSRINATVEVGRASNASPLAAVQLRDGEIGIYPPVDNEDFAVDDVG